MDKAAVQAFLDKAQAEFKAFAQQWADAKLGVAYQTGQGIALIAKQRSYGVVPVEDVLNGTAKPIQVLLTQDGLGAITNGWHDGPEDADAWVYYEKWGAEGRVAHGYVHKVTRKLLQVG